LLPAWNSWSFESKNSEKIYYVAGESSFISLLICEIVERYIYLVSSFYLSGSVSTRGYNKTIADSGPPINLINFGKEFNKVNITCISSGTSSTLKKLKMRINLLHLGL
jgi:hypothetical protein